MSEWNSRPAVAGGVSCIQLDEIFSVPASTAEAAAAQRAKLTRRSSSLAQLIKSLDSEEALCILDLGSTSPANIRYCTERGHKIYSDDLLISSTDPTLAIKDEAGKPALDSKRFWKKTWFIQGRSSILSCAGIWLTISTKAWSSR